jgi:hypothetical protein
VDQDGVPIYQSGQRHSDPPGKVSRVLVVSRDVTDRKRTEERIEASKQISRTGAACQQLHPALDARRPDSFLNEFGRFYSYTGDMWPA